MMRHLGCAEKCGSCQAMAAVPSAQGVPSAVHCLSPAFFSTLLVMLVFVMLSSSIAHANPPPRCPTSNCTERLVTADDDFGTDANGQRRDGSLRDVLTHACEDPGDDAIQFGFHTHIELVNPITLPADCNGRIFLYGRTISRVVISGLQADAPNSEGHNCLIRVESNENIFSRINIIDYQSPDASGREKATRVGLCIVGDENKVEDSTFGVLDAGNEPRGNDVGLLVAGNENEIINNHVSQNKLDGIQMSGNDNRFVANYVGRALQNCDYQPPPPRTPSSSAGVNNSTSAPSGGCSLIIRQAYAQTNECPLVSNLRHGFYLMGNASGNQIFGETSEDYNIIQYNGGAGIRHAGTPQAITNRLSPNVFNRNAGLGIDHEEEGPTAEGAVVDRPEITLIHVRNRFAASGAVRAVVYGRGEPEHTIHLYLGDGAELEGFAEGMELLQSLKIPAGEGSFSAEVLGRPLGTPIVATMLDDGGNTSEFSIVNVIEIDSDMDGISDHIEDVDRNGIVGPQESDPFNADSDGDGLVDAVEDLNKNGTQDQGETAGFLYDSDNDRISDFVETHGDGRFDPELGDTNPLDPDSDCDGLTDGEEDTNANGIVEWRFGETLPQEEDSDGDGISEGTMRSCLVTSQTDNCPLVSNPSQIDSDGDGFGDACDASK